MIGSTVYIALCRNEQVGTFRVVVKSKNKIFWSFFRKRDLKKRLEKSIGHPVKIDRILKITEEREKEVVKHSFNAKLQVEI